VDAIVKFTKEGDKIPLEIVWDDGRRFEVDRVLDVTKAASLKAGGRGTRYKCRIRGKKYTCFLMMKNGLWKPEINSCRMQQDTIK